MVVSVPLRRPRLCCPPCGDLTGIGTTASRSSRPGATWTAVSGAWGSARSCVSLCARSAASAGTACRSPATAAGSLTISSSLWRAWRPRPAHSNHRAASSGRVCPLNANRCAGRLVHREGPATPSAKATAPVPLASERDRLPRSRSPQLPWEPPPAPLRARARQQPGQQAGTASSSATSPTSAIAARCATLQASYPTSAYSPRAHAPPPGGQPVARAGQVQLAAKAAALAREQRAARPRLHGGA